MTSPKEHSSKEDRRISHVVFHNFLSLTKEAVEETTGQSKLDYASSPANDDFADA